MKVIKRPKQDTIITPDYIRKNRWEAVKQLGRQRRRGSILDVLELEGSYALENASEIYNSLSIGEELAVCTEGSPNADMLTVKTKSGIIVGFLPAAVSLLPCFLLAKGKRITCYVEYKDDTNGLLTIIVSLYSEHD
jgi:hypothetical protein